MEGKEIGYSREREDVVNRRSTCREGTAMNQMASVQPSFFDLKALAGYCCCSVRWLRDRLADRVRPLPHYRIEGKILVKGEEFEQWIAHYRHDRPADELEDVVNGVLTQMNFSPACAIDRRR